MAVPVAKVVQDRFSAKTWILWVRVFLFMGLGAFSMTFGMMFWTGAMKDANQEPRPAAGPPMVIMGIFCVLVAAMAAAQIFHYRRSIIRCFREGIECNLVGRTWLDRKAGIPKAVRVIFAIVSLQGFRARRRLIRWKEFGGAEVVGPAMSHSLVIRFGAGGFITFRQHTLMVHPKEIAGALNAWAKHPAGLPPYPG